MKFHHRTGCSNNRVDRFTVSVAIEEEENIVYSTRCLRSIVGCFSKRIRDPSGLGGIFDSGSLDDKLIRGEECLCPTTRRMSTASTFPVTRSAISIFTCQTQSSRPLAKRIFPSGKTRRRLSGGLHNFRYTWRSRLRAARRTLFTRCREV